VKATRTLEDVLDGGAQLVVRDEDDLVDQLGADSQRLVADLAHGRSVGEEADLVERQVLARSKRLRERIGVVRLDRNDLDVRRRDGADVGGHAGEEAAAADGDEDGVELADVGLAQELDGGRALTGDDVRVVERRDEGEAVELGETAALALRVVKVGAVEDDLCAEALDVLVLDRGRVERHDDGAGDAELATRHGDALRVVPCGRNRVRRGRKA